MLSWLCPEKHLGGLTISGLGWTDTKDTNCIGGLAREFYHRIWQYYNDPEVWVYQNRSSYNVSWQAGSAIQESSQTMWTFEPHVAEEVFEQWLIEEGITVVRNRWLDRSSDGVIRSGNNITAIKTQSYDDDFGFSDAETYAGKMFIDASYEGDLMAVAGVAYRIGRDDKNEYKESLNGVYFKSSDLTPGNSPYKNIDPYVVPGDPSSGLIRQIESEFDDMSQIGKEDGRLQAFNFRMCMTDVSSNRVAIEKPLAYDERDYELLFRLYEAGQNPGFTDQRMPNLKTDNNNSGLMSLDWPGGNYSMDDNWIYSEASYTERMNYVKRQRDYQQGLLWTMLYHPRVPAASRSSKVKWGLPKDEFADNGHWPYFSYVREARRMEGEMVMTEHHVKMESGYTVYDSIGQGSYSLDSHVVRRVVIDGAIWDEGGFYLWWSNGYPISYKSIVPKREQANNLLVPVCLSASHAAFGSIRMEPTYMILGQSAATAAVLSLDNDYDLQDLPYDILRTRLLSDGQRLKETFSSKYNSVLLNFGPEISNDDNSPAHDVGKISGNNWNSITADTSSNIINSVGNSTDIQVDLGKTLPGQKVIKWDLDGFISNALGTDYSTGVYQGNARSALYVNDGKNSDVALGVRISGLDAGVYGFFLTAVNTNTTVSDAYEIYVYEAGTSDGDFDFSDKNAILLENQKDNDSWLVNQNFAIAQSGYTSGNDIIIVVEGLESAGYRAFINTLEIVPLAISPLAPKVVVEPESQTVALNGSDNSATFTCCFKSSSSAAVRWYRKKTNQAAELLEVVPGEIEIIGPDYDNEFNYYSTSLVMSNIDHSDVGSYICYLENEDGSCISNSGLLLVAELQAHWSLDQQDYSDGIYNDISGYNRNVSVSGTPQFVNGADNSSDGSVSVTSGQSCGTAGSWDPLEDTGKFSISCWLYWTGGTQTSMIMDKADSWSTSQMMWALGLNPTTKSINFVAAGSSAFQTPISSTDLALNRWHHLIVTYDKDTKQANLYVDMKYIDSCSFDMGTKADSVVHVGCSASGNYFNGMLDDIRIYNYVLDERGMLEAYNGAAADKVNICLLDSYSSQFDITGPDNYSDCRVDLYDLSCMMNVWFSSGLYPNIN